MKTSATSIRVVALVASLLLSGTSVIANPDVEKLEKLPDKAICQIEPSEGDNETYVVFHLAAYDSDGKARYRTLSASFLELLVGSDGSVSGPANPCVGPLKFFD